MRCDGMQGNMIGAAARASLKLSAGVAVIALAIAGSAAAQTRTAKKKAPDLSYKTIDNPQFVAASQASFLGPKDIVLGVTDGKTAKAYPAAILSQHGVVQDSTADGPIAITW